MNVLGVFEFLFPFINQEPFNCLKYRNRNTETELHGAILNSSGLKTPWYVLRFALGSGLIENPTWFEWNILHIGFSLKCDFTLNLENVEFF